MHGSRVRGEWGSMSRTMQPDTYPGYRPALFCPGLPLPPLCHSAKNPKELVSLLPSHSLSEPQGFQLRKVICLSGQWIIGVWPSMRSTIMSNHRSETPVNKADTAPALTGQEESLSIKHCYYEGRSESTFIECSSSSSWTWILWILAATLHSRFYHRYSQLREEITEVKQLTQSLWLACGWAGI